MLATFSFHDECTAEQVNKLNPIFIDHFMQHKQFYQKKKCPINLFCNALSSRNLARALS